MYGKSMDDPAAQKALEPVGKKAGTRLLRQEAEKKSLLGFRQNADIIT